MRLFFILVFSTLVFAKSNGQVIQTVAGTGGTWGFAGDAGPAALALLNYPNAITLDAAGNMFLVDFYNSRVRKVDTSGIITTIAGTGVDGFSGDGGSAMSAQLNNPNGVAVDAAGNVYVSDRYNHRIRKINPAGIISTFAGAAGGGYAGDGGPATAALLNQPQGVCIGESGSIYICDKNNSVIRRVSSTGIITTVAGTGGLGYSGDGGPATTALLSTPNGVSMDAAGNLYIADNNRVRKVTAGIISTVAGNGNWGYSGDGGLATSAQFQGPYSVCVDAAGNLYIADQSGNRIRKVTNGIITTVAGDGVSGFSGDGGLASLARLNYPTSVTLDNLGNLYIADRDNYCVRRVNYYPRLISFSPPAATIGSIVTLKGAVFSGTSAVSFGGVAATSFEIENDSTIRAILGNGATGNVSVTNGTHASSLPGFVYCPGVSPLATIAANAVNITAGTLVTFNAGVINSGSNPVYQWKKNKINVGSNSNTYTDANHQTGDSIWCIFTSNTSCSNGIQVRSNKIFPQIYNRMIFTVAGNGTWGFSGDSAAATTAQLGYPYGVAKDAAGNVFISDNNRIRKIGTDGIITTIAGTGTTGYSGDGGPATSAKLYFPEGLTVDGLGNIYIADNGNHRIRKVDVNGIITTVAGNGIASFGGDGGVATAASINQPKDVTLDNAGNIYIADNYNHRIRKISNGIISTVAGNSTQGYSGDNGAATSATLNYPNSVTTDPFGNIYIGDTQNQRIRKVSITGVITTVAGTGTAGYNGEGIGPQTMLDTPMGISTDDSGNVFIADAHNNRIRKLTTNGILVNFGGNGSQGYSGDGGPALLGQMYYPFDVTGGTGDMYIADYDNSRIRRLGAPPAICVNNYWLGTVNNAWENPANWSCGTVPNAGTNVFINSGTVVLNSNAIIWSLTIAAGVSFTVTTPHQFIVLH